MKLRILKKKSKQAVKILINIGHMKQNAFWPADGIDNYHNFDVEKNCSIYAMRGTPMIYIGGALDDCEEQSAYEFLQDAVINGTLCPETFPDALRLSGYSLKRIESYANWMNDI